MIQAKRKLMTLFIVILAILIICHVLKVNLFCW